MYFAISDEPENTDLYNIIVLHEVVLLETEQSATMFNAFELSHIATVMPFVYHCEKSKIFPFR